MRLVTGLSVLATLTACGGEVERAEGPVAGDPGTYSRMLADGTPVETYIRADGSFLFTAGKTRLTGSVTTEEDKTCFDFVSESAPDSCWTNGPIRPGGTFETVSDEGEAVILTYSPDVLPAGQSLEPGEYSVGDETTQYGRSSISEDGTYIDYADGEEVGRGRWNASGERACFDPEGDADHQKERCWINGIAEEDGSFMTHREDGSASYRVTPLES